MFKKYIQFIVIILPLILLLVLSAYFGYESWKKYTSNVNLKTQLEHTKLLQSLEHSMLNEIVCVATMSQHKSLMAKVCDPTKKTTDLVMHEILKQKKDPALYELENMILGMRNSVEGSGTVAVEKLVNGELDKKMNAFIQKYTMQLKEQSNSMDKQEYIEYYSNVSTIAYATESEKALVSYYLSLKKFIPTHNLIYWDQIISKSQIFDLNRKKISILHEDIDGILQKDIFQNSLRSMEDIRLDIMSNAQTGQYKSTVASWVSQVNIKQKSLHKIENMLLGKIFNDVNHELEKSTSVLFISALGIILSLLGLLFFIMQWRRKNTQDHLFNVLLHKISQITDEDKVSVTSSIESHKMAYEYVGSNYETIYENNANLEMENKTNKAFLNNLAYEIQTPLNGISGYTKLLKETTINDEQNEFIDILENSFENLDSILSKLTNQSVLPSQKLEVENVSFDVVHKIESAVETFSIKADQKDIVLGLFIEPSLFYKVKGDATKLSQIITNLIENALDASNAYDSIDIVLENVHDEEEQISIKFSINDQGIGYNDDELMNIRNAFTEMETVNNIANLDMRNLSISNKIIKRMGGKLEVLSRKGEGSSFFFVLSFEKDSKENNTEVYPSFKGMKVGLALPSKDINRQIDKNLKTYVEHLDTEFTLYDYDTIFDDDRHVELPDIMFAYHHYARLEGELEEFSNLQCKVALITSGTLRSRINTDKFTFSSIVYAPITMSKIVKIFVDSKLETYVKSQGSVVEKVIDTKNKEFENIHILVAEDNEISYKIVTSILGNMGIKTSVAIDGQKAFELRRENDFDMVFMDIDMPIMDGFEATSKILYYEGINQFKHVPIIALTADTHRELEKYLQAGMDDYLAKPIDEESIQSLVRKYCIDLPKEQAQTEEDALIAKVLSGDFLKE